MSDTFMEGYKRDTSGGLLEKLKEAVQRVDAAEKMALAGSYEQDKYVKAALRSEWPTIRAYLEFHIRAQARSA